MLRLWLGLTDIYNLFHAPDLEARLATLHAKRAKSGDWRNEVPAEHRPLAGSLTPEQAHAAILELRALHVELDYTVLEAYGWASPNWREHLTHPGLTSSTDHSALLTDHSPIHLAHDFQQVETLPENDRTRYTITPQARKDLLTRLLKLNHQRAAEEKEQATTKRKTGTAKQQVIQLPTDDLDLFRPAASKPARLAFPKSERQSLTGEPFLFVLVHYFMNLAGEEATVRNLDGVFHLLRNRTTHRDNIIAAMGTIGEAWFKGYNDEPPNKLFIPFLKKLEEQRWIEVNRKTGQLRRLPAFKQPTQPHPWQELDVNIALQVLKSEPEVIDIITETSKSTRVSSAFGITQSA